PPLVEGPGHPFDAFWRTEGWTLLPKRISNFNPPRARPLFFDLGGAAQIRLIVQRSLGDPGLEQIELHRRDGAQTGPGLWHGAQAAARVSSGLPPQHAGRGVEGDYAHHARIAGRRNADQSRVGPGRGEVEVAAMSDSVVATNAKGIEDRLDLH